MKKRLMIIIALAALLTGGAVALFMLGPLESDAGKNILAHPDVNFSFVRSRKTGCRDLTLFQTAIVCRNPGAVRHYLDMGADIELRSVSCLHGSVGDIIPFNVAGYRPLHMAIAVDDPDIVEILLKHGANPNSRIWPYSETPLMKAAVCGNARIVRLLLDYGADPHAVTGGKYCMEPSDQGRSVMDYFTQQWQHHREQRKECIEILKAAME